MKTKFIPVEYAFKEWKKDPMYLAAHNALEEEFAFASARIKARADAETPRPGLNRHPPADNRI